jgi:hypothetical protein
MAMQEGWPKHEFDGGVTDDPDPRCRAVLQTATEEIDGFNHFSECGYRRSEH